MALAVRKRVIILLHVFICTLVFGDRSPLPDPLSNHQINSKIFMHTNSELIPIHDQGKALFLLHDLDGNGYTDVFALVAELSSFEEADYSQITDYARLFEPDRKAVGFFVRLFYQKDGDLQLGPLIPLGRQFVFESFLSQEVMKGENVPFAAAVTFATTQGRLRRWIIFNNDTSSVFTFQERSGRLPQIEDIDDDGIIDVVMHEEDFEAGIGNETYLSWYRWNGSKFALYKTVNVVRNLRLYLRTVMGLIEKERWRDLSEAALSREVLNELRSRGLSDFDMFGLMFRIAGSGASYRNEPISPDLDIKRAVYPQIRENPFIQRDDGGFFFPLTIRFETRQGGNHLYTARVYMLANPFEERQFTFGLLAPQ